MASLSLARVGPLLRSDRIAGALLLAATAAALTWSNTAGGSYARLRDATFGPAALHLHLSAAEWAADGVLAIFFFTVGLELKQEFVTGDLSNPRRALVPIIAAIGGVAVPAVIFAIVTAAADPGAIGGWAVPTATDIAFAVSVLAVVGRGLPTALRTFLLTLSVVDDLIAISIIAVVYTDRVSPGYAAAALVTLAVYAAALRRRITAWWILLPLALLTWALTHASGIHATVAGVLLGLIVPARTVAPRFEHRWRPWSNGLAVPVFAFFAAGVDVGSAGGLGHALGQPITIAVIIGLVVGKPIGIVTATWITVRAAGAHLHPTLRWAHITAVGVLAGIGFTVSLLVGSLAYGAGPRDDDVKIGVLSASVIAAVAGAILLRRTRETRET